MTFDSIFVPDDLAAAVADDVVGAAMLEAEAALAAAQADEGVISREAAEAVAEACRRPYELGGREAANPVVPLARALKEAAPEAHRGATSQDILDTAAMLVARRARLLILSELDGVVAACARLASEHRATAMAGRTLMQQAQPVTFGLKAAGWLSGVAAARDDLREVELAAQLGGPVGIASPQLAARFAERLELAAPPLPWHGDRTRVARLAAALAIAAGACEKVALDIVLLAQNEVGEVSECERRRARRLVGDGAQAQPGRRDPRAGRGAIGARRRERPARGDGRRARARGRARGRASGARCRPRSPAPAAPPGRCARRSRASPSILSAWRRTSKASPVSSTRPRSTP